MKHPRILALLPAVFVALTAFPSTARATMIFDYGMCTSSQGCDQTINFPTGDAAYPNAGLGTQVVGDTNPPSPLYNVFVDLLDTNVDYLLHANGSGIDTRLASDTNVAGPGFLSISLTPDSTYAWGAIEFQLDSFIGSLATGTPGLTFSVWDQFSSPDSPFTFTANFPWEQNNGENQHYHFHGTNGEVITKLQITYAGTGGNTIQDIHNIDVNTTFADGSPIVPEPASLTLFGLGLLGLGYIRRRKA